MAHGLPLLPQADNSPRIPHRGSWQAWNILQCLISSLSHCIPALDPLATLWRGQSLVLKDSHSMQGKQCQSEEGAQSM